MSEINMKVVNSTCGLGDTEYSLCNGAGLLKFDKPAMDECCEMINSHDNLVKQVAELRAALSEIKNITGELSEQNPANFCEELAMEHDTATFQVYEISNKALCKALKDGE